MSKDATPISAAGLLPKDYKDFNETYGQDINVRCLYSSVTFSDSNEHTEVTFHANKDREQCGTCEKWFPHRRQLDRHKGDKPIGCSACRQCFAKDDILIHASTQRHFRCFVPGCKDMLRLKTASSNYEVETHVQKAHTAISPSCVVDVEAFPPFIPVS